MSSGAISKLVIATLIVCTFPAAGAEITDRQLAGIHLGWRTEQLEAGSLRVFTLYAGAPCCPDTPPAGLAVEWRLEHEVPWASFDPATATLTIDPKASPGSRLRLFAVLEHGRRILSKDVIVFSGRATPLVGGAWQQVAEIDCESGAALPVAAEEAIEQLTFLADHTFTMAWRPFEAYQDYWGFYATTSPAGGNIVLQIDAGNFIPADTRTSGTFEIIETSRPAPYGAGCYLELRLVGVWLGSKSRVAVPDEVPRCGMVFEKGAL